MPINVVHAPVGTTARNSAQKKEQAEGKWEEIKVEGWETATEAATFILWNNSLLCSLAITINCAVYSGYKLTQAPIAGKHAFSVGTEPTHRRGSSH